ncbi:MAG TPA: septum formation protein Maf [Candidatus Borkfalkia avistercoris]|uniref:dTTP/UTP pyrophosphatase n=1 Tax=Candidatus Borkfalkia avistercoris TaxID=2838504 RepID=A0A9D2ID62_9FIRM|nr:septum formation protein Maf [Candidatus Borkfalkia avistercoris]
MKTNRFVLASASPRRREILSRILPAFEVIPSDADEHTEGLPPREAAEAVAIMKAESVFARCPDAAVLGADTVVAFEGRILGKPKNARDAAETLSMLSGKSHEVFTGWCLLAPGYRASGAVRSAVEFNVLSDEFIRSYVASGLPMDKAGSYGIQDDARIVKRYEGSFTNIVGLPEEEIKIQLEKLVK